MSVGLSLLVTLINHNDPQEFVNLALDSDLFNGSERDVYLYIKDHLERYGLLPQRGTIEVSTNVQLPDPPPEPLQFWMDLVIQRAVGTRISSAVDAVGAALRAADYSRAANLIHEVSEAISRRDTANRIGTLLDLSHIIMAQHDARQQCLTETFVPFGFPYLDEISDGLQRGETVAIAGRTGIGKSYFMSHFAKCAHDYGKIPLFVSMEMSANQIARRILSLKSQVPENRISRGNLTSTVTRDMVVQSIMGLEREPPFYVIDGKFTLRTDEITSLCQALKPDVVYIDGAYLVSVSYQGRASSRWDKIADVAESLKVMAGRLNIPVVGSYQANADKSIYGSRAIQHLASIVLFLADYKPDGKRESWELIGQEKTVEIVKGRSGEQGKFKVIFDLLHTVKIYQDEVLVNFLHGDADEA